MSWFNRFTSGARRLASNMTNSVRRRVTDFGNWLTLRECIPLMVGKGLMCGLFS